MTHYLYVPLYFSMNLLLHIEYLIGHNYDGHYFHAEDLSVNNYVRENIVCGIKVRE